MGGVVMTNPKPDSRAESYLVKLTDRARKAKIDYSDIGAPHLIEDSENVVHLKDIPEHLRTGKVYEALQEQTKNRKERASGEKK